LPVENGRSRRLHKPDAPPLQTGGSLYHAFDAAVSASKITQEHVFVACPSGTSRRCRSWSSRRGDCLIGTTLGHYRAVDAFRRRLTCGLHGAFLVYLNSAKDS